MAVREVTAPVIPVAASHSVHVSSSIAEDVDGIYLGVLRGDNIILEFVRGPFHYGDSVSIDISGIPDVDACSYAFYAFKQQQKIGEAAGTLAELPANIELL